MTAPITLTSLEEPTLAELRHRYGGTTDAETRTRYQMLLLSQRGRVAIVIADNLRTHTSAGSLLVREPG